MSDGPDEDSKPGRLRRLRTILRRDGIAGLINAVVSVPDGLASAALAGVNPVYGLYTSIAAPITGSSLASTQLMQIATTGASALAAGQAIAGYGPAERDGALFLLTFCIGVWLAIFGIFRLGRLIRFVSHAVMTGFLFGVAVVLILDQSAPLVGLSPGPGNEVVQFLELLGNLGGLSVPTLAVGLLALLLAAGLGRTRLANMSSVVALIVPTLLVVLLGWDTVAQVADVSPIPQGLPPLSLPDPDLLSPGLVGAAFAIAVVIAVQGAGVSQSIKNPDRSPIDPSRDMIAQGMANATTGLISGIPAGGSVGQTALNVSVGAKSRWGGILSGVWMLVIVLLLPGLVGLVPMAALAALMILAGLSALDLEEARSIWNTGGAARWAILVTFVSTLVLSIPQAVGAGVLLTVFLYVISSANDVVVRERVRLPDGRIAEADPPRQLPSREATVLEAFGSLFFAGARTLAEALPSPEGAERPVVILRLRGRTQVGATLIDVLDDYADALADAGGRLYLSGVGKELAEQLRRAGKLDIGRDVQLEPADDIIGISTDKAFDEATEWLGSTRSDPPAFRNL